MLKQWYTNVYSCTALIFFIILHVCRLIYNIKYKYSHLLNLSCSSHGPKSWKAKLARASTKINEQFARKFYTAAASIIGSNRSHHHGLVIAYVVSHRRVIWYRWPV